MARLLSIFFYMLAGLSGAAFAQSATAVNGPPVDVASWLMSLGPIGALVYGAVLLGRAVERGVSIRIELSLPERERLLVERGVNAMEDVSRRMRSRSGDSEVTDPDMPPPAGAGRG